jgi:hypothetical protein
MTSQYLQAAYERMKLPIRVGYFPQAREFPEMFVVRDRSRFYHSTTLRRTPAEATAAYFALCDQLSQTPPPPGATAGASAPAHSIEPAALAEATEVSPTTVAAAEFTPLGSAATISPEVA